MIFVEPIFKFDGTGILVFVFTDKSTGRAVIMDLDCFERIGINGPVL